MENNKAPHGTFTQIPNVFIDLCDISDEAYRLYTKLYRQYGTRGGTYTGSLRKLADLLTMNKDKVHRNLRALTSSTLIDMNTANNQLIVTINTDDLWQLNTLAKLGEHIPRWTNLKETLQTVSNLRQERLKNETVLSQIYDTNDESVSETRQQEEDIKPPVEQDKKANSKPRNTDRDKTISNTGKTVTDRAKLLTSEQLLIDDFYCHLAHKPKPPKITEKLIEYWDSLIPYIYTQEDMNSLYEYTAKDCAKKTDTRVYPGNLADCRSGWQQEQERNSIPVLPPPQPQEVYEPIQRKSEPLPGDMQMWMIDTANEFGEDETVCVNELEWCFQHTTCTEENFYSKLIHAYERTSKEKSIDTFFAELKQDLSLVVESVR